MPNATELCATADLKTMLGITSSAQDTLLGLVKDSAEQYAKIHTGRDLLVTTYTDYYDGNGARSLRLRQRPIVSVTSIYADPARLFESGSLIPASDLIADSRSLELGWIELFQYVFTRGAKSIKVVYVAGYATIPSDLSMAVKLIAAKQFKVIDKKMFAETSRTVGDQTITLNPEALPKDALNILDRYRRIDF